MFKHLEVNVFPSVPYTLSINIRRDEAAALQQYFKLEVNECSHDALRHTPYFCIARPRNLSTSPTLPPQRIYHRTTSRPRAIIPESLLFWFLSFAGLTNLPSNPWRLPAKTNPSTQK